MNNLHYREQGSGPSVILIHGFPLNLHLWDGFAEKLSESFQVVTPDLPGFGKSAAIGDDFSIEDVARTVGNWITAQAYDRPVIVGHSLGGYVALALAAQDKPIMSGMCLFHSTALPDSEEKKESRNKVLEFIENQGVHAFTSNFVGQLYADPQHASITRVKNIAVMSSSQTVMAYTRAMRDRKDQTSVLKAFQQPILFLAGEKDQGIPAETIQQQANLSTRAAAVILPDVAHMGMFESEGPCLKKIKNFVEECRVTF